MLDKKISVVLCTRNRAELFETCLLSLVKQTASPELFEIIIVDNNSKDNTKSISEYYCSKSTNIRYLIELKTGLSYARNTGWKNAKNDYVAFIDDDAIAMPSWVENIIFVIENIRPYPDAIGGKVLPYLLDQAPQWFDIRSEIREFGKEGWIDSYVFPLGFCGSNMIIRKIILEKFDGFSEEYGMLGNSIRLGEESELFYRMNMNKQSLYYFPQAIVLHAVMRKNFSYLYNLKRLYQAGKVMTEIRRKEITLRKSLSTFVDFIIAIFNFIIELNNKNKMMYNLRLTAYKFGCLVEFWSVKNSNK
jgi:glucosyl-dolichyl phosphate glucuronosyltransferase